MVKTSKASHVARSLILKLLKKTDIVFFVKDQYTSSLSCFISSNNELNEFIEFNVKFLSVVQTYIIFENIDYLINNKKLPKDFVETIINSLQSSITEVDGILYTINCMKDPYFKPRPYGPSNAHYNFYLDPI